MELKVVCNNDFERLSGLMLQLAQESPFMMLEPNEVPAPDTLARRMTLARAHEYIWVAKEGDGLLGYVSLSLGTLKRNSGVGTITIGVSDKVRGRGVGSELMKHVIVKAHEMELHRLQLYVQTRNLAAIKLYHKFGFEVEGTIRAAVRIENELIDKFLMGHLL